MTVCFLNAPYKYEAEAVLKLFFPLERFNFIFDEDAYTFYENPQKTEDFLFIKISEKSSFVELSLAEKLIKRELSDVKNTTEKNDETELEICKILFEILKESTGKNPKWGFQTGIRPVKLVNDLYKKGFNDDEVFAEINRKYKTSKEKIELSIKTAKIQEKILKAVAKNSFSLYISVPFCPSRCSYCSFVSHSIETVSARKLLPDYVDKLCDEIKYTANIANDLGLTLDTVYIGGGTPTTFSAEQLFKVMDAVKNNFNISNIREYTVEAGRSDTISREKLEIIKKMGSTRISINPQTMSDKVLKVIGRNHTSEDFVKAYNLAREIGFDNINTDIIAGLPADNIESFKDTINKVAKLSPEAITIHTLTVKRSSNLYAIKDYEDFDSTDVSSMLDYGYKTLDENGYLPYYLYRQKNTMENLENVGFSKPNFECFYNINIMEECQTILAVGAGASTKLVSPKDGAVKRIFNYKFPYEYISKYDEMLQKKAEIYNFFK